MRYSLTSILIGVIILIFSPTTVYAACSASGYTVVFINGILNKDKDASQNLLALGDHLGESFNGQPINYKIGYNASHWQGIGDVIEAVLPQFDDYDLQTILRKLHDDLQTQKVLLVGHSQGSVYANLAYDYLTTHGMSKNSVAVYAVATPTAYVAGNGKYINFEGDTTIYNPNLQIGAVVPPVANATFKDWWNMIGTDGDAVGHSFITMYLDNFAKRMVSEMQNEMFVLRSLNTNEDGYCFEAPKETASYKAIGVGLAVGEPVAAGVVVAGKITATAIATAAHGYDLATAAMGSLFGFNSPPKEPPQQAAATDRAINDTAFGLLKAVGASSLTPKQVDELQRGKDITLGGAAILALVPQKEEEATGTVLGTSTEPLPELAATTSLPEPSHAVPAEVSYPHAPDPVPVAPSIAIFLPPQNIDLSNWRSSDGDGLFCDISLIRTVKISWDPVAGAASYEIWKNENGSGSQLVAATPLNFSDVGMAFRNWVTPLYISVVALDGSGSYATSTVVANDFADKDVPSVLSQTPAYGSTNVPTNVMPTITYSKELDPVSVVGRFFSLSQLVAGSLVPVDFSVALESDGKTVDIIPTSALQAGGEYDLGAQCPIKDLSGNYSSPLLIDISHATVTFTVAP